MTNKYNLQFLLFILIGFLTTKSAVSQGVHAREEARLDLVYQEYGLTGENVVIGIIDRGIDYFHPDFIDENNNSRILYIYDMLNPAGANDPNNPYGIGTIFSQEDINESLAAMSEPLSMDRYGHGTATTGIAVGNGAAVAGTDFQGVASKAKIIVVKAIQDYFPPFDDQPGQEGFYNPAYIPVAMDFLRDKFDEAGLPAVALINLGSIGGPTDGTSTISRAINDFVEAGYPLVCGVGDDGGGDNHAYTTLAEGETKELLIQKSEPGNLRLDLWYSEDDRFEISIERPDNSIEGPFQAPQNANASDDRILTDIYYYHRGANVEFFGATSNRRELLIDFTGETGTYKVIIKATTVGSDGSFHATLNPSNFSSSNKFLSYVVEGYSINDFTSAELAITPTDYVVKNDWIDMDGNYQQFTGQGNPGELWTGSSSGPTHSEYLGIDFAACGEVLYAAYSPETWYSHFPHLLVQGGDNNYGIQNAVSAAAPLTTGVIALMLQLNPSLSTDQVKEILQNTAREDGFTGTTPNIHWGYGKLDAYEAINEVQNLVGIASDFDINRSVTIAPNPAKGMVLVKTSRKIDFIRILNANGQLVYEQPHADHDVEINTTPFESGIYFMRIFHANKVINRKLLKE